MSRTGSRASSSADPVRRASRATRIDRSRPAGVPFPLGLRRGPHFPLRVWWGKTLRAGGHRAGAIHDERPHPRNPQNPSSSGRQDICRRDVDTAALRRTPGCLTRKDEKTRKPPREAGTRTLVGTPGHDRRGPSPRSWPTAVLAGTLGRGCAISEGGSSGATRRRRASLGTLISHPTKTAKPSVVRFCQLCRCPGGDGAIQVGQRRPVPLGPRPDLWRLHTPVTSQIRAGIVASEVRHASDGGHASPQSGGRTHRSRTRHTRSRAILPRMSDRRPSADSVRSPETAGLTRCLRAPHPVIGDRCPHEFPSPHRPVRAHLVHRPGHGTASHRLATTLQLPPRLAHPVDGEVPSHPCRTRGGRCSSRRARAHRRSGCACRTLSA